MSNLQRPRILCVDDEPMILEGLALHLRRRFEVETAPGSLAALELIQRRPPFAVVISDMRMPGMDGAAFLASSRKFLPDAVRILLTGHADVESSIAAINKGQIFRFLTKPCLPPELLAAVTAAVEQHRLVTAERALLEETLHGSIKTLVEVLSLASPLAFGRATRIKQLVSELADRLDVNERWQVEVAAMLSQLGGIALPAEVAEKVYYGWKLSEEEQAMVARSPAVTERLLGHIPRLEAVRAILTGYSQPRRPPNALDSVDKQLINRGAELLRVACDFDVLVSQGTATDLALSTMQGQRQAYEPAMLEALKSLRGGSGTTDEIRELRLNEIKVGMVLAEDMMMGRMLLVARGSEITESFVARFRNINPGTIKQPLRVIISAQRH